MINIRTIRKLENNDGLTLKAGKIIRFKSGYQVADCGVECTTAEEVMIAIKKFNGDCGIWFADGIYYVDHSFRVKTLRRALEVGRKYNQISIYGWKLQKLYYC